MSVVQLKRNRIINEELDTFTDKIQEFQSNGLNEETQAQFKSRRLMQGVYGQRQSGEQMMRIKIPGGALTSEQLKTIADVTKNYSQGILHITTRQDIQLHYVKLTNVPEMLDKLASVGLTTREACGNSIRNVSASPYTGLLRDQVFDVSSAVEASTLFFLRNKDTQELPRKFKIAFSENSEDHGVTGMHDLGAIATIQDKKAGFKVVVGGGLGSQPFPAVVYSHFIPAHDLLPHFLAIARMFNQHGDRIKRMKARIKFLVHKKWGIKKFIEECNAELARIRKEDIEYPAIKIIEQKPEDYDFSNPFNAKDETKLYLWYQKNVLPTLFAGKYMILVHIPLGDLTPEQTNKLCDFVLNKKNITDSKNHVITVTDDQNLVLRSVPVNQQNRKSEFEEIYHFLNQLGLGNIGTHDMADPISCPGTSTCNLGITHSKGLAQAIRERIKDRLLGNIKYEGATIHMSGCPNSCARHHISTIGFFGRSDKIDETTQAPAYGVLVGGGNKKDGVIVIGKRCDKILARRIPDFIDTIMQYYELHAQSEESFVEFCYRMTKDEVNTMLTTFDKENQSIQPQEKINYDWGKDSKPYVVEFGEGECAV